MKINFFVFIVLFSIGLNAQITNLKIGEQAPEISLPQPNGELFELSSLKGKMVLIDFWASWCGPCVVEQPELKILYEKYKNQNETKSFEILGVSLDRKKENWEKIIHQYQISWPQVSDLKYWKSQVAKDYFIQELPFNVIIDGEGKIIAINLHGKELEDFLAKYLN